ncbi:MAG: hypothetical protein NT069_34455, partial [Planctomycetota bacterium]|nr:hypothetical protein [Planctomycetota bacterium]
INDVTIELISIVSLQVSPKRLPDPTVPTWQPMHMIFESAIKIGFIAHIVIVAQFAESPIIGEIPTALITAVISGLATGFAAYFAEKAKGEVRLRAKEAEIAKLKAEFEAFKATLTHRTQTDYGVLVDGITKSGKSAIIAKWADPSVDIKNISKTLGIFEIAVYLCSRLFKAGGRLREQAHRLKFVDVPGESTGVLSDVLHEGRCKFVMLVVDPTQEEASFIHLNTKRLKELYTPKIVADQVCTLLVYISKSDQVQPERLAAIRDRVENEIVGPLRHRYPSTYTFHGSALDGTGLHNALGFMAKQLGISEYFVKHSGDVTPK